MCTLAQIVIANEKVRKQIQLVCIDEPVPHFSTFGKNYTRRFNDYKIVSHEELIIGNHDSILLFGSE